MSTYTPTAAISDVKEKSTEEYLSRVLSPCHSERCAGCYSNNV